MRTVLLARRTTKALFRLTQQRLMLLAHSGPWPAVSPLCARNGSQGRQIQSSQYLCETDSLFSTYIWAVILDRDITIFHVEIYCTIVDVSGFQPNFDISHLFCTFSRKVSKAPPIPDALRSENILLISAIFLVNGRIAPHPTALP